MTEIETPEMPIPFGIDADTGRPLEGIDDAALDAFKISGHESSVDPKLVKQKAESDEASFGVSGDVDPNKLDEAGWAVLFSPGIDKRIRAALQPLLDHRKAQVGDKRLFKIFEGDTGYEPEDTAEAWLKRRKVGMYAVDPQLGVPFYILIVAPPEEIPFEFQYSLDLYWAVGRLWFSTADEFRQYVASVIQYEKMAAVPTSRQMAVFSPLHDFDKATQLFSSEVAEPLAKGSGPIAPVGSKQKFSVQSFIGDPATKDSLFRIMRGSIDNGPPAVLFSGGHGKSFRRDDERQAGSQGALICQDWTGYGRIERDHYFDASDVPANAKLHGMVHFLFACYGGGCPRVDNFKRVGTGPPKVIADKPMMGRLPQALLAHPNGGALAVLAHIDRAWACSFRLGNQGQTQGFRDVIGRFMRGDRLGQATDEFNRRWAVLSTELANVLEQIRKRKQVDPKQLASQWIARDDARNYVLFGDPAVRLRTDDMPPLV